MSERLDGQWIYLESKTDRLAMARPFDEAAYNEACADLDRYVKQQDRAHREAQR